MDIDAAGASQAQLRGSGKDVHVTAKGASRLRPADFAADSAAVELRDPCRAEVRVKAHLDYSLSGASHLDYRGNRALGNHATSGASSVSHVP